MAAVQNPAAGAAGAARSPRILTAGAEDPHRAPAALRPMAAVAETARTRPDHLAREASWRRAGLAASLRRALAAGMLLDLVAQGPAIDWADLVEAAQTRRVPEQGSLVAPARQVVELPPWRAHRWLVLRRRALGLPRRPPTREVWLRAEAVAQMCRAPAEEGLGARVWLAAELNPQLARRWRRSPPRRPPTRLAPWWFQPWLVLRQCPLCQRTLRRQTGPRWALARLQVGPQVQPRGQLRTQRPIPRRQSWPKPGSLAHSQPGRTSCRR